MIQPSCVSLTESDLCHQPAFPNTFYHTMQSYVLQVFEIVTTTAAERRHSNRSTPSRLEHAKKGGCRTSKYFLLGGSPALCPNGIEIGHVFDAILYKRSSFPGIPFGMPYFRLFCFQLSKSMPFLMEKDNFPFFRSESCNEAY